MPGKIPRLFQAQDCLAGVEQIQLTDGGKSLQFFFENQDNWCCKTSINDDSTYFDDPPVYSNSGELFSSEMVGFTRVSPSLSTFLITACLHEMVFSARYLFSGDHGYSTEELLPLWLNGPYAYPDETYSFYLAYGKVLIMNNWVAFNDPDAASLIPDFSTLKYIGRGMPDFGIPPADTL
ncbi:hypothetical protein CHU32_16590 [Superficieibacter electus]|uniref:Uncharacterized protein n=2 Tax=Superficieibacter electus TaxID=2022662 RepID=A0A2P5GMA3_9ENTR|nr:hypothetical protein CHU33_20880 [Superficieibacter electus]POP46965.1 hypothetical protein CHU32_16590 [Superficieibacter electus]